MIVLEFCHLFLHEILLVKDGKINADQEIAFAFVPGEEPMMGKKFQFKPSQDF